MSIVSQNFLSTDFYFNSETENGNDVNWLSIVFISGLSQFLGLDLKFGCPHIQMVRLLKPWVVLTI